MVVIKAVMVVIVAVDMVGIDVVKVMAVRYHDRHRRRERKRTSWDVQDAGTER